ncbi:MAG: YdeI/OmpD-associated family protein [Ignavibacteriaceae bacterium]|nr:YdeI/OmpD-associated family protein [Ignavibacteriaceae bacterium]
MDLKYFKSSADFRKWLEKNHALSKELWVGFYKKNTDLKGITYPEAVDQALCFGWIDGIKKKVDELSYTNRFTPRKSSGIWSTTNIKRVKKLSQLGLMHSSGLQVFNQRDKKKIKLYSYERKIVKLDKQYEEIFKTHENAWEYFLSQPPSYQKVASQWIMSAKKEETRQRRLNILIKDSANGRRLAVITLEPQK